MEGAFEACTFVIFTFNVDSPELETSYSGFAVRVIPDYLGPLYYFFSILFVCIYPICSFVSLNFLRVVLSKRLRDFSLGNILNPQELPSDGPSSINHS